MSESNFDAIIVGAGASGCVLAARLSEIPDKRVLLIEAGPDAPPGREHNDIRDPFPVSYGNARFFWRGLTAEMGADPGNGKPRTATRYLQGFGVGGGSNVNGMAADRGLPSDYDEWCALGATGWGWNDVLPYFKKLEHDQDFSGPLHGKEGPIPVRRLRPQDWSPFAQAFARFFRRRGVDAIDDYNGDFRDGVSSIPMNCLPNTRVSASMAYLTKEARQRPNLTIFDNSQVERVCVRNGRIDGVEVRTSGGALRLFASEVILACGAVHSPALLLKSGIGSAKQLRPLGIPVVCDLPGVGRNLQNHPAVALVMHLTPHAIQPLHQRTWQQNQLRYSSKVAGCPDHDMLLMISNKASWHSLGRSIATIGVFVHKAYSKGRVELVGTPDGIAPHVRFNLLDDSRDFERLVQGLRLALDAANDEEIMKLRNEVFIPNDTLVAHLARRSAWNCFQAWLIALALRADQLRRTVLRNRTLDVWSMARDQSAIRRYVRTRAQAVYHPCGTCRMGGSDNPDTVVDSSCRVLGIHGLRVVDASVFPSVPCANTHIPVLMVAEKMADQIKADWLDK